MALNKCKECNAVVSSKAVTCPKCGIRIVPKSISWFSLIGFLFLGYIAISIIAYVIVIYSHSTNEEYQPQSTIKPAFVEIPKPTEAKLNAVTPIFKRPFEYIGMTIKEALRATKGTHNPIPNSIDIDSKQATMMLESDNNVVSFVEVEFKNMPLCSQQVPFDPELILSALSMNFSELELARKQTHLYVYYYHERKLKISVLCDDYGHFAVHISSKYYGM